MSSLQIRKTPKLLLQMWAAKPLSQRLLGKYGVGQDARSKKPPIGTVVEGWYHKKEYKGGPKGQH